MRGTFSWDSLPESIGVPTETGLVALTVNGKSIDFPERDDAGRVWLSRKAAEGAAENRLDVVVHRKLTDDIPITLTTQVELHVSGKSREELLGRALPDGFVPMSLDAPMPARIEADGKLRVQVWPGTWTITLVARASSPDVALTMPKTDAAWGPEEVWTFEARPRLRLVQVEGVPSIDPQQTTIPDAWKRLPTFRVKPGETMKLVQTRRGDTEPAPDQLSLARTLWLDFDGGGFTVQDRITGSLNRAWRLEMGPETELGRVAIGGRDQFITRAAGGSSGVEVRQGQLDLTADSRVDGAKRTLAAVGWAHDFASVSGTLHMPPGWRLFAASGADDVPQSWIRSWSLLDMFLVLILAVAIARLWGWKWGALSLAALTLTFPEDGAPQWIWAAVLVGEALYRVVPANWFKKVMVGYRLFVIAILLVMVVPFWVQQVRAAMYPALGTPDSYRSTPWWVIGGAKAPMGEPAMVAVPEAAPMGGENANAPAAVTDEERPQEQNVVIDGKMKEFKKEGGKTSPRQSLGMLSQSVDTGRYADVAQMNYYEHDPKAMVQTGPGLPRWNWSTVYLQWSGPVAATQKITLYLIPPWLNFVLALIRVALTALLAFVMLDVPGDKWPKILGALVPKSARAGAAAAAIVIAAAVVVAPRAARAASDVVPPPEVLKDLQQRLLEKPDCFPNCASSPRMELEADGGRLTLRMEIGAAAATAVPLPGSAQQWLPTRVAVDGQPANGLVRVGDLLWLELEPGAHQVVMDGPLPTRTTVQIRLPLKPHYVTAKASGWTLAGLH
ncbi:MAG TPA: hypothetical protein VMV18_03720, partial [bacterium]|nr:hypothetical protein [bacterium]